MTVSFNDYLDEIRNETSEVIYKIELLDKYENVLEDVTEDYIVGSGSINVNLQNGSRRSANITLQNEENKYTPNPKGKIWIDTKFKISSGLHIDGEDFFISNGVYCLSQPEINSYFSETTASFQLSDKWSLADGTLKGTLKADYIVPVGTNIGDAVKAIIVTELGEVQSPLIVPTAIVSPYTLTLNRGDNFADILIKLAEMISYECYFDKNGQFRFQPVLEDDKRPVSWEFSTSEVTYLGSTRQFDFTKVKNSVYVFGDNISGSQVQGHAQDNYIFSPTNVAKIDERVLVVEDDIIFTGALADERAAYELRKATIVQESTNLECIPIFHLDCNDIITIEDEGNDLNRDRYIISGVSMSLDVQSSMKVNVWKSRPLE